MPLFVFYLKEENHGKTYYEQIPQPNEAWFVGETVTDAVQFAVDHELVKLDPENPEQFFGAMLWGEWLTAPSNAALMFYSVTRNEVGIVIGVDFNFVVESEINANYHVVNLHAPAVVDC